MHKISTFILLCFTVWSSISQSTRDAGEVVPPPVYKSTKQKKVGFVKKFFGKKIVAHNRIESIQAYEERMRAVARQKTREARMANRPEYSNKLYFGHKRKPKKREPGKKKWCKICEFAH